MLCCLVTSTVRIVSSHSSEVCHAWCLNENPNGADLVGDLPLCDRTKDSVEKCEVRVHPLDDSATGNSLHGHERRPFYGTRDIFPGMSTSQTRRHARKNMSRVL